MYGQVELVEGRPADAPLDHRMIKFILSCRPRQKRSKSAKEVSLVMRKRREISAKADRISTEMHDFRRRSLKSRDGYAKKVNCGCKNLCIVTKFVTYGD